MLSFVCARPVIPIIQTTNQKKKFFFANPATLTRWFPSFFLQGWKVLFKFAAKVLTLNS